MRFTNVQYLKFSMMQSNSKDVNGKIIQKAVHVFLS